MATNKFYDSDHKMIKDLEEDEIYTIYGKEENYTEHGILQILKVLDSNDNEFRLYSTDYLNSYLTSRLSIVDGVDFIVKEIMGVKVPIIEDYNQNTFTYLPY